jgi:hypothetical protein
LQNFHPQLAPGLEREPRGGGWLLDGGDERTARADDDLVGTNDAGTLSFEEVTIDGDVSTALDLTVGEHAGLADDELRPLAERDRALLEETLDFHECTGIEFQGCAAEDVAPTEVAAIGHAFARLDRSFFAEDRFDFLCDDAARAVAFGAGVEPIGFDVGEGRPPEITPATLAPVSVAPVRSVRVKLASRASTEVRSARCNTAEVRFALRSDALINLTRLARAPSSTALASVASLKSASSMLAPFKFELDRSVFLSLAPLRSHSSSSAWVTTAVDKSAPPSDADSICA